MSQSYWRRPVTRRSLVRGSGIGMAGLAGAALVGCGGDDEDASATVPPQTNNSASGSPGASATAIQEMQVAPGLYDGPVPPTVAEQDPLQHAEYGGVLKTTYLDPPTMDINRALSCTVAHPLLYTNNKLVRGAVGPNADPFLVDIEPDLAESWETDDGSSYTFKLRQGVKTHNVEPVMGREFTAEDAVLTLERYRAGGPQADVYAHVTSIEAPDDYTVVVNLDRPLLDFPSDIAAWGFIFLRELIEDPEELGARAVGTGPFVQRDWIPKQGAVFEAHPDYFEEGLPFLDGVETYVQNDAAAAQAGFETHNYFTWTARDTASAEQMAERSPTYVNQTIPLSNNPNTRGWWFQMKNPTFGDERVRRAISLAFDRNEFDLADTGGDNANPEGAFSFISTPPWPLLFDSYPTAAAQGPWYQYDPEEASKMMQAAGYSADNPLSFEIAGFYQRTVIPNIALPLINAALPEVNITWREVDNPTHATMMADRNFPDALGYLIPPFYSFDLCTYPWYHSTGAVNYNNVDDPTIDDLLERQRTEADVDARKTLWREIWDRIHDQVWEIAYPAALMRGGWHNYVLGYRPHAWMGAYGCYTSDQARAMWLASDAPMRDA